MGRPRGTWSDAPRDTKYHNVPCEASDGRKFQSKAERDRYEILKALERRGVITDLQLQVNWPLEVSGEVIGNYRCDFYYHTTASFQPGTPARWVVEDVKGIMTPVFVWKAKHFRAQYGFKIDVVGLPDKQRAKAKKFLQDIK